MAEIYARIYHRFANEFPEIYADDRTLSAWVRLLVLADASWPMQPPLPRSVRSSTLKRLVSAGLVIVEGDAYTIRGLDAERCRRRNAAVGAAAKRWQSDGNADAHATADAGASASAMPRARDRAEQSRDRAENVEIPPPPAERGRRTNGTNPRATGTAPRQQAANPRANGTSVRQVRRDHKRGTTALGSVLRKALSTTPPVEAKPSDDAGLPWDPA